MTDLKIPFPQHEVPGYEDDLVAWTEGQIALLRARQFEQVDLGNLLQELEGMVSQHRRELKSRLEVLIMHLLKCRYQPGRKSRGWTATLDEQRSRIVKLLDESPSLNRLVPEYAHAVYPLAAKFASRQTGLPAGVFPSDLPFTVDELLDIDFLP